MKNTFGKNVSITLFGESHGSAIGAVIDGLAPGLVVDNEYINKLDDITINNHFTTLLNTVKCFLFLNILFNSQKHSAFFAEVSGNINTEFSHSLRVY